MTTIELPESLKYTIMEYTDITTEYKNKDILSPFYQTIVDRKKTNHTIREIGEKHYYMDYVGKPKTTDDIYRVYKVIYEHDDYDKEPRRVYEKKELFSIMKELGDLLC